MRSTTPIILFFLLMALGGCAGWKAGEPGASYEVYGGSKVLMGPSGRQPLRHGYRLLGRASGDQTFYGTYPLYLILVKKGNLIRLDAVQFSDGSSLQLNIVAHENLRELSNAQGIPDKKSARLGVSREGRYEGGYLLVTPRARDNRSITIFVGE